MPRRYPGTDGARQALLVDEVRKLREPFRKAVIIAQCSDEMLRDIALSALTRNDNDMMIVIGAEVVWRRIARGEGGNG